MTTFIKAACNLHQILTMMSTCLAVINLKRHLRKLVKYYLPETSTLYSVEVKKY